MAYTINRVFTNGYLHIFFSVLMIYNQISIGVMMHNSTEKNQSLLFQGLKNLLAILYSPLFQGKKS